MAPPSDPVDVAIGGAIKCLVMLPALAIFFEDDYYKMGRGEFAFWLAGHLFSWSVLVAVTLLWLSTSRFFFFVVVWPWMIVAGICVYAMYHFFEAVVQRARDVGLGKGIAYVAAVPPLNLPLYAFLLLAPGNLRKPARRRRRGPGWPSRVSARLLRPARNALAGLSRLDDGAPVPSKPELLYGPPPEERWISSFRKNRSSSERPPGRSPRVSSHRRRRRGMRTRSFRRRRFARRRR